MEALVGVDAVHGQIRGREIIGPGDDVEEAAATWEGSAQASEGAMVGENMDAQPVTLPSCVAAISVVM